MYTMFSFKLKCQLIVVWVYAAICLVSQGNGEPHLGGPADVILTSITSCPEPEQYKYTINIKRHKINRTHEAFDGDVNLGIPLDEETGVYVNIAKKANDGYKPNAYEFKDNDACQFLMKWTGETFMEVLKKVGEPQKCPVKPGTYSMQNYMVDYRNFPKTFPYGDFRADIYLIRDGDRVSCIQAFITVKPKKFI